MVTDGAVLRRLQPGEPVQVIALLAGQLQRAGERADDLRRGGRRAALLQPDDVVHGDARELGQVLPAKAGRPAGAARGQASGRWRQPVAPRVDRRPQARLVSAHDSIIQRRGGTWVVLVFLPSRRPWWPAANEMMLDP